MIDKCPGCGTGIGQPHQSGCDVERCSKCGCQRVSCECDGHNPSKSMWTGEWTRRKYVIDCGCPAVADWSIVPAGQSTWLTLDDGPCSFDEAKQTLIDELDTEILNARKSKKTLLACKSFEEYVAATEGIRL